MGQDDVSITVVTPEHAPLWLFGDEASEAVAEELRWAGVALHTGVVARKDGDGLVLEPSGERLDVQRVFSVPRIVGPAIDGSPSMTRLHRRGRRSTRRGLAAHLGGRRRCRLPGEVRRPRDAPGPPCRRCAAVVAARQGGRASTSRAGWRSTAWRPRR